MTTEAKTSPIRYAVRMGHAGTGGERETAATWTDWHKAKKAADRIKSRRHHEGWPVYPAAVRVVIAAPLTVR